MSFFEIVAQLSDSMLRSTWIFLLTLIFSMPLGLLICVARMYAWKPVQWLMKFYISVVRGTPLMLQLLVIYFGKYFLFGLPLTTNYRFWAVIIAFSLNYAAYFAAFSPFPLDSTKLPRFWGTAACRNSCGSLPRR